MIELPEVREGGMSGRNEQRKPGTARGSRPSTKIFACEPDHTANQWVADIVSSYSALRMATCISRHVRRLISEVALGQGAV
jgi:hypothetical protein